jgi:hypothetical protein
MIISSSTRLLLAIGLLLGAGSLVAQESSPGTDPPRQRAPLADTADLQPAVDVGGPGEPARAPAPAAASAAPQAPQPAAAARVQSRVIDTLDLGTTSITGNQELPKVLYIVPWKRSDLGDLMGRPINTLLDEVLAPVDPEVFERSLLFYESLYGTGLKE